MKYRRVGAVLSAAILLSLSACSRSPEEPSTPTTQNEMRLGVSLTAFRRTEGESAELDALAVAVLVGQDGKIRKCCLDEWEITAKIENGEVKDGLDLRSKGDQKEDYGMKTQGGSVYEWYEQAAAFCAYAEGKTAEEIAALPLKDGKAAEADLVSKCSIVISGFVTATEQAAKNAVPCDASSDDMLGLAINVEQNGNAVSPEYDGDVVAVAKSAEGKITACAIDSMPMTLNVNVDAFTEEDGAYTSKKQQGTAYGMKVQSPIGKEWYEQAASLEKEVLGKTAEEVAAIPLKDGKAQPETDLASSCTIEITGLLETVMKAQSNAR